MALTHLSQQQPLQSGQQVLQQHTQLKLSQLRLVQHISGLQKMLCSFMQILLLSQQQSSQVLFLSLHMDQIPQQVLSQQTFSMEITVLLMHHAKSHSNNGDNLEFDYRHRFGGAFSFINIFSYLILTKSCLTILSIVKYLYEQDIRWKRKGTKETNTLLFSR